MAGSTVIGRNDSDVVEVLLELLHESEDPLTIPKLRAALPADLQLTEGDLAVILDRQAARGMIFRFAPYRSDGPRYWAQPAEVYAAMVILAELEAAPLSLAALEKKVAARLTDCPAARRKEILEGLLQQGKIYQLPPQPGERAALYRSGTPNPVAFYRPVVTEFAARARAVTEHLLSLEVPLEDCWTAIDALLDETLFTEGEGRGKHGGTAALEPEVPPESSLRDLLLEQLAVATTTQRRGGLISLRELRQAMPTPQPGKEDFDACVLQLAQDSKVWLYRHDYAASLAPAERDALVSDGKGNYYNGISLRT